MHVHLSQRTGNLRCRARGAARSACLHADPDSSSHHAQQPLPCSKIANSLLRLIGRVVSHFLSCRMLHTYRSGRVCSLMLRYNTMIFSLLLFLFPYRQCGIKFNTRICKVSMILQYSDNQSSAENADVPSASYSLVTQLRSTK